jgi:hypothetical protein
MNEPALRDESLLDDPLRVCEGATGQGVGPHWRTWFWGFVALAVLDRTLRYVLRFPLWEDESFLCVSLFHRSFLELLRPLEYHQVAPVLFLWLEKAAVAILGFNELALRLPAYLSSLASLALFVHLVRRLVAGAAGVFCVALFAVSYPGIRYAAEAKPYSTDLLVSLVLIVLTVEWLRGPRQTKWLAGLVLFSPVAVGLSLPALFTTAGLSLLLLGTMVHHPRARHWGWWLAYNLTILASALAIAVVSIRPQMKAELGFMSEHWANAFVPLTSAWAVLKWLVTTHTGALFAHPVGDQNFGSTLTPVLLIVGIMVLARHRRWPVALLLLLPLGMHLGAAALQRYPYGGHVKFSMYAAPMIYLIMGIGSASLMRIKEGQGPDAPQWTRAVRVVLLLIGSLGAGCMVRDILVPFKTTADARQRALAMWLWHDGNFEDRTVCIKDDLGQSFSKRTWTDLGWSAMYLCNKSIYTPRHMIREPRPRYAPAPSRRYLRCVLYLDLGKEDFQQEAFDRWLAGMKQKYEYVGMDRFPLPRHNQRNTRIVTVDYIEVYTFVLTGDNQELGSVKVTSTQ